MGFGSTAGPPMLSTLYNNHKRIVQTPGHVMILTEMVHDARIVRMNGEHAPDDVRRWFGDSIGWWEGDTLVVDTTNFTDKPSYGQGTRDLHVVERFSRVDEDTVLYNFTVEDPNVWETVVDRASTRGNKARSRCTSTPATKATTRCSAS